MCSFLFMPPTPLFSFLGTIGVNIQKFITYGGLFLLECIWKLFFRKGLNWEIGDLEPGHCIALGQLYNSLDLSSLAQNKEDLIR